MKYYIDTVEVTEEVWYARRKEIRENPPTDERGYPVYQAFTVENDTDQSAEWATGEIPPWLVMV